MRLFGHLWRATAFSILLATSASSLPAAEMPLQHFITAHDGKLFDGTKEFRFLSWNIPNLLIIEDNFAWDAPHDWLLPDEFELTDAFVSVQQLGGTVVRSYSLPVQRAGEDASIPKYIHALGKYNEEGFRTLDLALKLANEHNVRLILPLINNWPWQGGREEFAAWRHKSKDDFWMDPQLIADFEATIRYVLTRTNTLTGVRYLDDKSILCWETGNEVRGPSSWTKEIASFIKSIDTNHLVMDGYDEGIRPEVLEMPAVDIVTTHHYPSLHDPETMAGRIRENARLVHGKKTYIIGEFGFVKTDQMSDAMRAIRESPAAGGLLWSLRFRNRTGGFYWHSEPDGANLYKAFHWPPSPVGEPYDETRLLNLVCTNAFAIRSLTVPEIPMPPSPKLLPITDASAISWQGSVGATGYQVERAANPDGPWQIIATNVDEAQAQYRAQFADESASAGTWFYRVRAQNAAGISGPSAVAGPVTVTHATLVDELADFSKISAQRGHWTIASQDSRVTKEDIHRAAGILGDTLVYHLSTPVKGFRVFSYFPKAPGGIKFSVSDDGELFHSVAASTENDFHGAGDYGYWKPVLFHAENLIAGKFLKLELTGETQIGRVEITHATP